jgi:hypothetical protein
MKLKKWLLNFNHLGKMWFFLEQNFIDYQLLTTQFGKNLVTFGTNLVRFETRINLESNSNQPRIFKKKVNNK